MASKSNFEETEAESFYDRFGSVVSLEEIASVHGKGGCDCNGAVKILNGAHESESVATATIDHSNGDVKYRECSWPSGSDQPEKKMMERGTAKCNDICLPSAKVFVSNGTGKNEMKCKSSTMGSDMGRKSMEVDSNKIWLPKSQGEPTVLRSLDDQVNNGRLSELSSFRPLGSSSLRHKAKNYVWCKTAANSVSNVIGEDDESYSFPKSGSSMAAKPLKLDSTVASQPSSQKEPSRQAFSKNCYSEATKPLKLDSIRISQSNSEREPSTWCSEKYNTMHKDMEDFLVKMLGEGFQLERDAIRDILEKCGYDMTKCLDRASNLSAATLANQKSNSHSDKFRDSSPKPELYSPNSNLQYRSSRGDAIANHKESNKNQKDIHCLQNEIWYSLFDVSKKNEESPEAVQPLRKSVALAEMVVEPFKEPTINENVSLTFSRRNDDSGENENYQLLRRAVTEHRATMREYYNYAIRAFSEGDYAKADKLLEQGTFFKEKAVEADEESYKQLVKTRNAETDNEMLLDLHDQGAKEAVHLLKCHLSSLAGIPSFKYLKVIIEKNEEVSKGARRRLVLKLLERESIEWSEEDPGTIILDLEKINPTKLSFAKKKKMR